MPTPELPPGTIVDSNVLLDIFTDDPRWADWSADQLTAALDRGPVIINPIVYAELSCGFDRIEDLDAALSLVRDASEPQAWLPIFVHSALISLELGRRDEANAHVTEVLADPTRTFLDMATVELATVMNALGRASELRAFLQDFPRPTRWHGAALAILDGDYARAADLLDELGIVSLGAQARLHAATAFAASGRQAEADAQLRPALEFFRSVGATRYVREAEALLAAAS